MTTAKKLRVRRRRETRRYGPKHRAARRWWAKQVARGDVRCCRCGELIDPDWPWDLDHDDICPDVYVGVSHPRCHRGLPHRCVTSRRW